MTIVNENQELNKEKEAVIEQVILKNNPLNKMQRITELLVDWIMICLYLIVLFLMVIIFNYFVYGTPFPYYSETASQLIATFTATVPIALIFAWMEYKWGGTLGKQYAGLIVVSDTKSFGRMIGRNFIKFLPWQLGHMSVIRFMNHEPDALAVITYVLSLGLMLTLILMGFRRKDKRHLADLIAGTQVQLKELEEEE